MKYDIIGEDWGQQGGEDTFKNGFLYSGIEGTRRTLMDSDMIGITRRVKNTSSQRVLETAAHGTKKITNWMKTRQVCELSGVIERGVMGQMAPPILQIEWEGHSMLAICWDGMIVQVECVQDQEGTRVKVWTKLKNGLFGWKLSRTGRKIKNDNGGEHCAERGPPSVKGIPKWVPATNNITKYLEIKQTNSKNESVMGNKKRKITSVGGEISLGKKVKALP